MLAGGEEEVEQEMMLKKTKGNKK